MNEQKHRRVGLGWQFFFAICLLLVSFALGLLALEPQFKPTPFPPWVHVFNTIATWLAIAGISWLGVLIVWQVVRKTGFRFGLRTIFGLTIVLAAVFAWIARERAIERKQWEEYIDGLVTQLRADDFDVREEAARGLGSEGEKLRGHPAVLEMLHLLPGDWDEQTLNLIDALDAIGDKRALETLRSMQNPPGIKVPGDIGAELKWTIDCLER